MVRVTPKPTPHYVPVPPGIDKDTQIERYDWDLHDFELEVDPILRSLVGRCLQQSRIELIEEFEDKEWKDARVVLLFYCAYLFREDLRC